MQDFLSSTVVSTTREDMWWTLEPLAVSFGLEVNSDADMLVTDGSIAPGT